MTNVRPAAISAFAVAAMSVFTALAQLNPTVNVLTKPQAPVPGECEQGLAPAQPRTLVAEAPPRPAPAPAPTGPPPTLDLKTKLRAVESAAQQDDRDRFKAALASARSAITAYPPGGERDAANDVLRIYEDLGTLWEYAFTSPSGAFFNAATNNGALLKMLERYPGYDRAIAESTLSVGGTTVYPTAESRAFLVAEASRQLAQLGVKMPERIAQAQPPRAPAPPPGRMATPEKRSEKAVKPQAKKKQTHVAEAKPRKAVRKPRTKIAENRVPRVRKPAPAHVPARAAAPHVASRATTPHIPSHAAAPHVASRAAAPQTATEAPAPAPSESPAPAQVPAPAPPAAAAPAEVPAPTTNTASMPPAMQTAPPPAPTTTTAPSTSTTATTTSNPAAQQQSGGRVNLLFAIILIIVGIGVLIVLLRASD